MKHKTKKVILLKPTPTKAPTNAATKNRSVNKSHQQEQQKKQRSNPNLPTQEDQQAPRPPSRPKNPPISSPKELSRIYELSVQSVQNPKSQARSQLKHCLKQIKDAYHTKEIVEETKVNSFSFKKGKLVVVTDSSDIQLYKILNNSISTTPKKIRGHTAAVKCVEMNKEADKIFSWSLDKTIILWEVDAFGRDFTIKQIMREHGNSYISKKMDFLWSEAKRVLLTRVDHNMIVFRLTASDLLEVVQRIDSKLKIDRVFMSHDGERLITNSFDQCLSRNIHKLWVASEQEISTSPRGSPSSRHHQPSPTIHTYKAEYPIEVVSKTARITSAIFTDTRASLVIIEGKGLIKVFSKHQRTGRYTKSFELVTDLDDIGPADLSKKATIW